MQFQNSTMVSNMLKTGVIIKYCGLYSVCGENEPKNGYIYLGGGEFVSKDTGRTKNG